MMEGDENKERSGIMKEKKTCLAYSSYLRANLSLPLCPPTLACLALSAKLLPTRSTSSAPSLPIPPSSASSLSSVFPTCLPSSIRASTSLLPLSLPVKCLVFPCSFNFSSSASFTYRCWLGLPSLFLPT